MPGVGGIHIGLGGGGGAGLPVPMTISGLVAWYDASKGITKDGSDLVSAWADQSGSGNDLVQATGSQQPKWLATSGRTGGPAIQFRRAGLTERMKCAGIGAAAASPITVAALFYQRATAATQRLWDSASGVSNDTLIVYSPSAAVYQMYASGAGLSSTVAAANATWAELVCAYNGASSVFRSGATEDTGNAGPQTGATGFTLGNQSLGNFAADGYFQHVLLYSKVLSATERAALRAWMATQ